MNMRDELLIKVVGRFLFHREQTASGNPMLSDAARNMCDIDILEMWMLTQSREWKDG